MRRVYLLLTVFLIAVVSHSCKQTTTGNRIDENHFPRIVLWAWERPEDLTFLDPQRFGVAFLAQTLTVKDGEVVYSPRHQPLKLPRGVKLIAVTRIESQKVTREQVDLTDDLRKKLVRHIRKTLELDNVKAVQVDFDAVTSERTFYSQLLQDL